MSEHTPPSPKKRSRILRAGGFLLGFLSKLFLIAFFVGAGLFIGGFLQFATNVTGSTDVERVVSSDGIVVLTGGSKRIATALDLLEAGQGRRLLISGVNPTTPTQDIRKVNDSRQALFDCCVDTESVAEDTIGNARETAKWAADNEYTSLIVVTSTYHMPRSMLEFSMAMPDVRLTAYPVKPTGLEQDKWWQDIDVLRILLGEYVKYIAAQLRHKMPRNTFAALRATLASG